MKRLSKLQKDYLEHIAEFISDLKCFEDIGAEGQVALLYMNPLIGDYDTLKLLVDDFLKLLDLEKQAEHL